MDKNMDRPIEDMRLAQIGFLVNDIEKTKKEFARFFGVEEPETVNSGDFEITHTEYRGEPAPKAKCYMTFFGGSIWSSSARESTIFHLT